MKTRIVVPGTKVAVVTAQDPEYRRVLEEGTVHYRLSDVFKVVLLVNPGEGTPMEEFESLGPPWDELRSGVQFTIREGFHGGIQPYLIGWVWTVYRYLEGLTPFEVPRRSPDVAELLTKAIEDGAHRISVPGYTYTGKGTPFQDFGPVSIREDRRRNLILTPGTIIVSDVVPIPQRIALKWPEIPERYRVLAAGEVGDIYLFDLRQVPWFSPEISERGELLEYFPKVLHSVRGKSEVPREVTIEVPHGSLRWEINEARDEPLYVKVGHELPGERLSPETLRILRGVREAFSRTFPQSISPGTGMTFEIEGRTYHAWLSYDQR